MSRLFLFLIQMNVVETGLPDRIVFFDGVCSICNRSVGLIRWMDTKKIFHFATLQGHTAQLLFNTVDGEIPDSFKYKTGSDVYCGAYAVHHICMDLGGIYKSYAIFLVIPYFIKKRIYKFISDNRYRIMKKMDTCYIPKAEEKLLFLD